MRKYGDINISDVQQIKLKEIENFVTITGDTLRMNGGQIMI